MRPSRCSIHARAWRRTALAVAGHRIACSRCQGFAAAQLGGFERAGHCAHELARRDRAIGAGIHRLDQRDPRRRARGCAARTVELHGEIAAPCGARRHAQAQPVARARSRMLRRGAAVCRLGAQSTARARRRFERCGWRQWRVVALRAGHDPIEQPFVGAARWHVGIGPARFALGADEALEHRGVGARAGRRRRIRRIIVGRQRQAADRSDSDS